MLTFTSSSVTRWLLMVVGCAILEMAQPMMAAPEPAAPVARTGDTILYPRGDVSAPLAPSQSDAGTSAGTWVFVAMVGLGAGGYWYLRQRGKSPLSRRGSIQIEDTRALGNRQFLVVASCDGRRFLLGVAAGGIQMLSPLDPKEDDDDEKHV
ncbi:MAG: hypothetical protein RL376_1099 [Verrucomicrobiota bacterium]